MQAFKLLKSLKLYVLICCFSINLKKYECQLSSDSLRTIYQWNFIDYVWTSSETKQRAIYDGTYNYSNILPMDVDVAIDGRVFVSFVGQDGVPARFGVVSNIRGPSGPLIQPYPNWKCFDTYNSCDGIISVYRFTIDGCNRLWILDTGSWEGDNAWTCPAKVLVFDLSTNRLIRKLEIPDAYAQNRNGTGLLTNILVETNGFQCDQNLYIADTMGMALLMFDGIQFTRIEGPLFQFKPSAVNVTVADYTLTMRGGIAGMSLTPVGYNQGLDRFLYFRPLASFDINYMRVRDLMDTRGGDDTGYVTVENVLPSQAIGQTFSSNGVLFLGLTRQTAIACWNLNRPLKKENIQIIAQDPNRLQFIFGLKSKITQGLGNEELWAISNKFTQFSLGRMNFNEINFRILRGNVRRLIQNTACDDARNRS